MKKLSREYGWSALGVYLTLSALDFPFCYLLVKYLGTERIGEFEFPLFSQKLCGVQSWVFGGKIRNTGIWYKDKQHLVERA